MSRCRRRVCSWRAAERLEGPARVEALEDAIGGGGGMIRLCMVGQCRFGDRRHGVAAERFDDGAGGAEELGREGFFDAGPADREVCLGGPAAAFGVRCGPFCYAGARTVGHKGGVAVDVGD